MNKKSKESLILKYKGIVQNIKAEKRNILNQLDCQGDLTVEDYIMPSSNLCIILSCPGEQELIEQKVCVGQTGKNLDKILQIVIKKIPEIKPNNYSGVTQIRYKYTIINSCNNVHFREYNRAEPTDEEILSDDNIKRIKKELSDLQIQYYITCGDKAKLLFDNLSINTAKIANICHIGNVGLRNTYRCQYQIYENKKIGDLPENERDSKRIEIVAQHIIKSFK